MQHIINDAFPSSVKFAEVTFNYWNMSHADIFIVTVFSIYLGLKSKSDKVFGIIF